MADKSGTIEFPIASSKLQGKIDWTSTSNGASANTSTVVAILYAKRVDGYTTTGQSWSGYVKIQGKDTSNQTNISFGSSVSVGGSWVEMARVTLNNAKHNNDGTGSATISGSVTGPSGTSLAGITSSKSETVTLEKIARGTSITSFTISKRNETSLNFNWATADNVEALYYSTDNGSHWKNANISGTNYGNFFADTNTANNSALTPNTTYQCKIYVVKNTITTYSSQVSATTNAAPTISLSSKTETSITMAWSIDDTASKIKYSTNNGSSWSGEIDVNAKSGTYTISTGLAANTTYNIKFNIKRKGPQTWYQTATSSQTTYNYPNCTSAPNFTIGNSVKLDFYNPLNRTMSIRMWSHVSQAFVTDAINVTGTTYTFTPNANTLYASIPNNTSSVYNIDVTYSGNKYVKTGGSYSVNASACTPTFTNFAYKDTTDNLLTQAIDNNQVIVQNVSNVNVVISSANKMVAKNSATASKYQALFSNLSKTFNYSASDIDTNLGVPTGSGNSTFKVTAYDSRNIAKEVSKTINIIPYSTPVVNVSLNRLNNFEAETHLKLSGTFARVTIDNADKNAIQQIQYRYKESSASTWGSWTTMTIQSQGSGSYQTTEVTLSLDNTKQFTFEFQVTDKAKTTNASQVLSIGQPLMFLHTSGILEIQNGIKSGKPDGTGSFNIHGQNGSNIYWKENGYGDQFRIRAEFGGADDSNKLQIQGAVGDAGTTPALDDLMTISGKNGNVNVKGVVNLARDKAIQFGGLNTLRGNSSNNTILSANGASLYLRPNGDMNSNGETYFDTSGHVWPSGQVRGNKSGNWNVDRDKAIVRQAYTGAGYMAVVCQGTPNGTWTIGNLQGNESLYFNYVTDSDYSNNVNNSKRWTINNGGAFSGQAYKLECPWDRQSLTNANISHTYENSRSHLTIITATLNMTSNKPAGDGIILQTSWDNSGQYCGQMYFAHTQGNPVQYRLCNNGTWTGWENIYKAKFLYSNASGTTGSITLSESAANFAFIEILYGDTKASAERQSCKSWQPNGKWHSLQIVSSTSTTEVQDTRLNTKTIGISGTSFWTGAVEVNYVPGGSRWNANEITVYAVIGYR